MRKLSAATLALFTVVSLAFVADPAAAAKTRNVWVDYRGVNSAWPVRKAAAFIDRYTGTTIRFGACKPNYNCIRITEQAKLGNPSWAAVTYVGGRPTRIQLSAKRRTMSYTQRYDALVHELGHAFGIYSHNKSCASIMYYSLTCPNGRNSKLAFTAAERRTLKQH